ncbi:uncharacterized protein EAE98_012250 [Botrytis deweyae]|uniref:Uncharacterized protein n=1 Tax=Botrytis deweyae TaxID=2478750 RepID=A0ABQ7I3E2_9HELO|nr:uncharacterized protein EAE98_012250 [Botrytis deweyae]KAF7909171.1 hypothetical protein EAE98_012250 [Botrytis deweyae]
MSQKTSRPSKPKRDDFGLKRNYIHALQDYEEARANLKRGRTNHESGISLRETVSKPIASDGQKQKDSSCPLMKKATDADRNQGKAKVTWSGDAEKKKREAENPKKTTPSSTSTRS